MRITKCLLERVSEEVRIIFTPQVTTGRICQGTNGKPLTKSKQKETIQQNKTFDLSLPEIVVQL